MTGTRIAVVGLACRYPDANSPRELWENALAGRRAFRRLPDERMRAADYWSADPQAPDRFYGRKAAVLNGYRFDRVRFRIAGSTYRSTDLTHWLALDVAAEALADAGFAGGEGLPGERTGVVVGNTLTGEFTRANLMRLRWPYVRRTVGAALRERGWDDDELGEFLGSLEESYKQPFPPIDEDTLAGGLSNTIAGRICNHFDLKGGGYTVDGACSSSLLSVSTACRALADAELDVALAGGVDLSIDPFEIIGFSKTGALTPGEMRVYDRGSSGFWPGEGCGMVVLMREEDAIAQERWIYANIAGWGVSSDGKGSITRPEVGGYQLALSRAYERAGFGIDTVSYFEGHGTGTPVGDRTELTALSRARRAADAEAAPAAIGTVKGLIGHTKAAAGVAGLLKAVMAVHHEVVPPTAGCVDPHEEFTSDTTSLRMVEVAESWSVDRPLRAAVSSMGFGGINTHMVLEGVAGPRRSGMDGRTRSVAASAQDAELLLFDGRSAEELAERIRALVDVVPRLSYAELGDLAAELQRRLTDERVRAAVVARSPEEAAERLGVLLEAVSSGPPTLSDVDGGVFYGSASRRPRLGFLFPGQGTGRGLTARALRRRFPVAQEVVASAALPEGDAVATDVAQPRIVTGSVAGLRVLAALGIEADVAVGHSLGELTALHWAGAMDLPTVLRLAAVRGRTMAEHGEPGGTMAGIAASVEDVAALLDGEPVCVAGYNGPQQTVVSGPADAVSRVMAAAKAAGLGAARLRVSHAFHSPLMERAASEFGARVAAEPLGSPSSGRLVSTVTGAALASDVDVAGLLRNQILEPVRFAPALTAAAEDVDLFLEVGPCSILSGLAAATVPVPAIPLDTDSPSLTGLLTAVGAAYVLGVAVRHDQLFAGRLVRPLDLNDPFDFLTSPCEASPSLDDVASVSAPSRVDVEPESSVDDAGPLDLLLRLAAERADLPPDAVRADSRLLDDLHLSSITVGQLLGRAATALGVDAPAAPSGYATATVAELAEVLSAGAVSSGPGDDRAPVAGAARWVRPFVTEYVEAAPPTPAGPTGTGTWRVFAPPDHPIAEPLRRALDGASVGGGVLLCLPPDAAERHVGLALDAARAAVDSGRFAIVQCGRGLTGLAKTLHLEAPSVHTTVVDIAPSPEAVPLVVTEVAGTDGFAEVLFGDDGVRRVPVLRPWLAPSGSSSAGLGSDDVLLVTGGGKGITAECARALASDSGARLAILGRADPAEDPELATNLDRLSAAGVRHRYLRTDVTDEDSVRAAVDSVQDEYGPVTAILHGAGRNEPAGLTELDVDAFRRTVAPKIHGLRALLGAVDPGKLRLLVTFGSIIGRAGLRGEAHYATANEWLAELTRRAADDYPDCRAVCLEWSVWSGAGMGERLGVIESLVRDDIVPISVDEGVDVLRRVLAAPSVPPVLVVTGRAEGLDTIRYDRPELPLLRFVDDVLVHYPGVELVSATTLNPGTDPYLENHELDGDLLVPAVIGMEAMAQVACAVTGREDVPSIEDAEFLRPIVVARDGENAIRVAAVAGPDGSTVDVAIRSGDSGFAADHFRARLNYGRARLRYGVAGPAASDADGDRGLPPVPLDPARDLYGGLLFQGKRFQRLVRYHRVAALDCTADVSTDGATPWFSTFLPGRLLLGDPGLRDALMHGIQVCVPNATLLPSGVDRIWIGAVPPDADELTFRAVERHRDGDNYVYDLEVRSGDTVVERWDGLRLRAVRKLDGAGPWVPPLLGPYVQRRLGELADFTGAVVAEPDSDTALAVGRALNRAVELRHRPDGRPEVAGANGVSASHGGGVTLAVAMPDGPAGCDIEEVVERGRDEWTTLLGEHAEVADLVARETGEEPAASATRVWAAIETVQKAGRTPQTPLTLEANHADRWVVLAAGDWRVATFVTHLRGLTEPVAMAVLCGAS